MQHWTGIAPGTDWPSHELTTSGIYCWPMAKLSNFSPGRRTVKHSSQVGKIKPTPLTSKGWISIKKYWENFRDISRITRQTLKSLEPPPNWIRLQKNRLHLYSYTWRVMQGRAKTDPCHVILIHRRISKLDIRSVVPSFEFPTARLSWSSEVLLNYYLIIFVDYYSHSIDI